MDHKTDKKLFYFQKPFAVDANGDITLDTNEKVNGSYSARLQAFGNTESERVYLVSEYIPIRALFKYNLSWYVKTDNVFSGGGGATVDIHFYDQNKRWMGSNVNRNLAPTIGTKGWVRKAARVDTPENGSYVKIVLGVKDKGVAWFDNIQIEQGDIINNYNLALNSSFETNNDSEDAMGDYWSMHTLQKDQGDGLTTNKAHKGKNSILVNGDPNIDKVFYQEVDLKGEAGTPVYFSGWSKASGVSALGSYYAVGMAIHYESGTKYYIKEFTKTDHDWEYQEKVQVAEEDFDGVEIFGKYKNQTGKAWFDDFKVRLEGVPNALISEYNLLQNGSFEYNWNQVGEADEWVKYNQAAAEEVSWLKSDGNLEAYHGEYMYKISNTSDWVTIGNLTPEPLKKDTVYTASAVIKTEDVTSGGAVLKIDILDSSKNYITHKVSKIINNTTDWTRVSVSLSEAEAQAIALSHERTAAFIRVSIAGMPSTQGKMYFDSAKLFVGSVETKYEYTSNGNYVEQVTNPLGYVTTFVPDERGNVNIAKDPEKNVTYFGMTV